MAKKYLIIPIIILGFLLRLITINQSFWLDEASQAQMSSMSVRQILFNRAADFHPPFFYIIAHYWLLVGRSEAWLRLLPVLFGVATIYVLYLFSKKLFPGSLNYPLLSALFIALSPYHIYYSQEFRSYSLLCLLGTLSMYFFFQKKYYYSSVVNALLLYTHYSSSFLILTQLAYWFFSDRKQILTILLGTLLTLLLFAPWIPQLLSQLQSGVHIDSYLPGWRNVLSISPLKILPMTLFKLVGGRITLLNRYLYGIYIIFVLILTFTSFLSLTKHKALLTTWTFLPIFIMILTSLAFPQNQPFRIIYILPAIILVLVQSAKRYPKLFTTLILYVFIFGNVTYFTRPRLQREQWRQAITFLQTVNSPILVKFSDKFAPFYWYAPKLQTISLVPKAPSNPKDFMPVLTALPSSSKLYLVEYLTDLTDPSRLIDKNLIELGFLNTRTHNFEGVGFIEEFSKVKDVK